MDDLHFDLEFNATCCECGDSEDFIIHDFNIEQTRDETNSDIERELSKDDWKMDDWGKIRCPDCKESEAAND